MNSLAVQKTNEVANSQPHFDEHQIDILRNSICKGCNNDEFQVFLMSCRKTQLDPFMKQIYAVKRGNTMTIQTGIDGYRLIAERSGHYAPGPESTYTYDKDGRLLSATAYIKKQTRDGHWHTISASAYFDEYCQSFNGKPSGMWQKMPRTMLAKCAEALALRKAFPAEMSGLYTQEEMQQADVESVTALPTEKVYINQEQIEAIEAIISSSENVKKKVWEWLKTKGIFRLQDVEAKHFANLEKWILGMIQTELKQQEESESKVEDDNKE